MVDVRKTFSLNFDYGRVRPTDSFAKFHSKDLNRLHMTVWRVEAVPGFEYEVRLAIYLILALKTEIKEKCSGMERSVVKGNVLLKRGVE